MEWKVTTASCPPGFNARSAAIKPLKQLFIFGIDRDPQPLKAARRRVRLSRLGARQAGFDDLGQTQGRSDWFFASRL